MKKIQHIHFLDYLDKKIDFLLRYPIKESDLRSLQDKIRKQKEDLKHEVYDVADTMDPDPPY